MRPKPTSTFTDSAARPKMPASTAVLTVHDGIPKNGEAARTITAASRHGGRPRNWRLRAPGARAGACWGITLAPLLRT
jgi:hypothetical protein